MKKPFKIRHIMSDGTVRDSIEGVEVPIDNYAYQVIADCQARTLRELSDKKDKQTA